MMMMDVPEAIQAFLDTDDATLDAQWKTLETWIQARFKREPTIEAILFLMGIQSRGHGYEPQLEKEVKQALIMEGTYCAFEHLGFYEKVGADKYGHWIWERIGPSMPKLPIDRQEKLLRIAILRYFDDYLADNA